MAPNKFLAKLASDWGKPDGLVVVEPGKEVDFLREIPISRMWGIGVKTAEGLKKFGIRTIGQLAAADDVIFQSCFGNAAQDMRRLSRGEDDRPVIPERAVKSIGNEATFEHDLWDRSEISTCLLALTQKVGRRLRKAGYAGRTITVKIRFASFKTITRSRTTGEHTALDEAIYDIVKSIISEVSLLEGVRLLGVTVSNLQLGVGEILLFSDTDERRSKAIRGC